MSAETDEIKPYAPLSPEFREKALKLLRDLFRYNEVRQIASRLLKDIEEPTASSPTKASYYTEKYGKWMKGIIDEFMADPVKNPREFRYIDFPEQSRTTLYLMLHQGKQYLVNVLDFDGRYREFCQNIRFSRKDSRECIIMFYKHNVIAPSLPKTLAIQRDISHLGGIFENPDNPLVATMTWREELEIWLNTSQKGDKFHKVGLNLSSDEINALKEYLGQKERYIFYVSNTEVKVVRI